MPASQAIASVCKIVLVEPPMARSNANALSMAAFVTISRGLRSAFISANICFAALRISSSLSPDVASAVPLPGRAIPRASMRQFIEFAVKSPEHEPHVGQPWSSMSFNSDAVILPALKRVKHSLMPHCNPVVYTYCIEFKRDAACFSYLFLNYPAKLLQMDMTGDNINI